MSKKDYLNCLLLCCIILLLFFKLFDNGFIADDFRFYAMGKSVENLQQFVKVNFAPEGGVFRPVSNSLITLQHIVFGRTTWLYYLVNILLHVLVTCLLYYFTRMLFNDRRLSLFCAFIFALSFSHFEAVMWLSGQTALLEALTGILTLTCFLKFLKRGKLSQYWLALVLWVVLLMIKEPGIAYLVPLVGLWIIFRGKNHPSWKYLLPFGAVAAVYLTLKFTVWGGSEAFGGTYRISYHIFTNFVNYFTWLFMPDPYHPYIASALHNTHSILPGMFLVIKYLYLFCMLALMVWIIILKKVNLIFAFAWIIAAILPFVPFVLKPASRYLYSASIPFALMVAIFSYKFLSETRKLNSYFVSLLLVMWLIGNVAANLMAEKKMNTAQDITAELTLKLGEFDIESKVVFLKGLPEHIHVGEVGMDYFLGYSVPTYTDHGEFREYRTLQDFLVDHEGDSVFVLEYLDGSFVPANVEK